MSPQAVERQIEKAAEWIAASRHLVAFTGAGISTDPGLPDDRGPEGVWTAAEGRAPNASHRALVELWRLGKLQFLISQNVDDLHLASGFPASRLAELRGNGERMRCLSCDGRFTRAEVGWDERRWGEGYRTDRVHRDQPACPRCGGRLISSVVNFGDPLPQRELDLAIEHAQRCDLFFAIGSSLVVSPASVMPMEALEAGARLILLNRHETPFDELADLRIEAGVGEVLPGIVARVRERLAEAEVGAHELRPH